MVEKLKKFLICLSLLVSFLFIGNVKALRTYNVNSYNFENFSFTYNGFTYNKDYIYNYINDKLALNNKTLSDFKYIFISVPEKPNLNENSGMNGISFTLLNDCDWKFKVTSMDWYLRIRSVNNEPFSFFAGKIKFKDRTFESLANIDKVSSDYLSYYFYYIYNYTNSDYGRNTVYTNTFIDSSRDSDPNDSTPSNPRFYYDNNMLGESNHNVSFHLNGGSVMDYSNPLIPTYNEEDFQINTNKSGLQEYLSNITPMKDRAEFLGWYYDSNFTTPYNSSDSLTSDINLYAKFTVPHTFNFHLNGGWVYDSSDDWGSNDDFSFTLYQNEIENFFTNLEVKKATMIFEGWYYDANFNNPFSINDIINNDVNLYAKFRYEKVDDFLNNTTFNQYTFDTNYNYAIITKGSNSGDIYLGLNTNKYDITVYEYKENLSNYDNEKGFCLVPMYSKNGTYYYLLDTTKTLDTEVLVLPKNTFENNNYDFLLTNNAHITYTNNLEEAIIYDSNGNQINTNLQDTYQIFQDSLVDDENDLLTIFKNLTSLKDNGIFSNINKIWNNFKFTPIYNYLMILIVGSLIILIIKAAKRK